MRSRAPRGAPRLDRRHDLVGGRTWSQHGDRTRAFELGHVDVRDDPTDHHRCVEPDRAQRVDDGGRQREVRAVVHREPDDVDVLLERCGRDVLGRLAEPAVDDLHARVPQDPGDDLDAAVVPVEADLGDEHPPHAVARSVHVPNTTSSADVTSPTVAYAATASSSAGKRFTVGSAASSVTRASASSTAPSSRSALTCLSLVSWRASTAGSMYSVGGCSSSPSVKSFTPTRIHSPRSTLRWKS